MSLQRVTADEILPQVRSWCRQSVVFALMIRARQLGTGIPDEHALEATRYADEAAEKILARAGSPIRYATGTLWMTAVADETFRWVQDHLDRGPPTTPQGPGG